jgi:tetratricopeptide (TPR) repeat protein
MRSKLLLLIPLLLAGTSLHASVDPFYLNLLRDGQLAFDRKDFPAAVRHLRLACFGMLDEPRPLVDCLARLALAQDRADDLEGFRETFKRLAEVEERFQAYTQGGVSPELRTALEARLVARLPAATLESEAAFRPLVAKKAPGGGAAKQTDSPALVAKKTDSAPATVKKPVLPAAATRAPAPGTAMPPPAGAAARPAAPIVGPPAPPAAAVKPSAAAPSSEVRTDVKAENQPAPKPDSKPLTDAERKKMEQARQLLSQERPAKELKQAFELAREVADAHPGAKEAQHLAAEAAYRISRWSEAAAYFRRGGDPGDDEPERLFYLAVALHELGDDTAAAAALKRALPNLRRTPYVDSYAKTILGQ